MKEGYRKHMIMASRKATENPRDNTRRWAILYPVFQLQNCRLAHQSGSFLNLILGSTSLVLSTHSWACRPLEALSFVDAPANEAPSRGVGAIRCAVGYICQLVKHVGEEICNTLHAVSSILLPARQQEELEGVTTSLTNR
jgi:hypothetical protein